MLCFKVELFDVFSKLPAKPFQENGLAGIISAC